MSGDPHGAERPAGAEPPHPAEAARAPGLPRPVGPAHSAGHPRTAGPAEPPCPARRSGPRQAAPADQRAAAFDPLAAVRRPGDPAFDVHLTGTVFLDIVFTGLDHAPACGTETWARGMGQSPGGIANMATALARLGLRTSLAAAFGADVYGDYCWDGLADGEGVDLTASRRVPGWHSPLTVSMAYDGERTMVTHEHPAPPVASRPPRARGCVTVLEPGRHHGWLRQAHADGALVFADVGWDGSGRWPTAALPDLPYCHALLPNAAEAQHYTRTTSPERAVRAIADLVPIAVVTDGAAGALAVDSLTGEYAQVPGLAVEVLDPTGAGDVFTAGFMTGTLAGWPLADRLAFGNLTAALSVQHFGGSLAAPGWPEVATWWERASGRTDGPAADAEVQRRYRFLDHLLPAEVRAGLTGSSRRALPTLGFRGA
ncbi:carbohydrate kinase family protein [Streptomyces sp. 796.1]|uniref:carbohydrate kinase family protein n=1 Tax=Streptomyces sp. 796.1 TaxID=3163029 RepID=UPI0039C9EE13